MTHVFITRFLYDVLISRVLISKVLKENFADLREAFQSLSKSEQDAFLMAQIKAMDGGSISISRRLQKKIRSNKKTFYQ